MTTVNASKILLNDPPELWPLWWDHNKCVKLIDELEKAGFGPSYYTRFNRRAPENKTFKKDATHISVEGEIPF